MDVGRFMFLGWALKLPLKLIWTHVLLMKQIMELKYGGQEWTYMVYVFGMDFITTYYIQSGLMFYRRKKS